MARVVAYTRVSSEHQSHGASLGDQADRIENWLRENNHRLIKTYSEHGSGGSAKRRKEFQRLMADLEALKPDILIVDASDRFTRNALDGGRWVSHITELSVRLAVIEYDDGRVLNMSEYADRQYVTNAFMIADAERHKMSLRQRKANERATTRVKRPPWGVVLEPGPKGRRRLVPDPEKALIIAEIDRRILAGESMPKVVDWLREYHPGSFNAPTSLRRMLKDRRGSYVVSGIRSVETQEQLNAMMLGRRHIHGRDRKRTNTADLNTVEALLREVSGEAPSVERPPLRDHMLAGIFACGKCVATGIEPSRAPMNGYYANGNTHPFAVECGGVRGGVQRHKGWSIAVVRVIDLLHDKLLKLRDPRVANAVLERWVTESIAPLASLERDAVERQLAELEAQEAALEEQISAAFRLATSKSAALVAEAERQIERHHTNRLDLLDKRTALQQKLVTLPTSRVRRLSSITRGELAFNAEELLAGYQIDPDTGIRWVAVDVREVLKKWVRLIGPPVLDRLGGTHSAPILRWDFIDEVRPEPAPEYAETKARC